MDLRKIFSDMRKAAMFNAVSYEDKDAANMPTLYPKWEVGITVKENERYYYEADGKLYRVNVGHGHTTQADWTPDKTPAMWTVIDVVHAGTKEDPIPASKGMEYEYGKYYLDPEDEKIYLCQRTGEQAGNKITLQYLPHELISHYFVLAE